MGKSTREHYIPQYWMRAWTDTVAAGGPKLLYRKRELDGSWGRIEQRTTSGLGYKRSYYTKLGISDAIITAQDDITSRIVQEINQQVKQDGRLLGFTHTLKRHFSTSVLLMSMYRPSERERLQEQFNKTWHKTWNEIIREHGPDEGIQKLLSFDPDNDEFNKIILGECQKPVYPSPRSLKCPKPSRNIFMIPSNSKTTIGTFLQMLCHTQTQWTHLQGPRLLGSDAMAFVAAGSALCIPTAPDLMICAKGSLLHHVSEKAVYHDYNRNIVTNAKEFVFAHPNDEMLLRDFTDSK